MPDTAGRLHGFLEERYRAQCEFLRRSHDEGLAAIAKSRAKPDPLSIAGTQLMISQKPIHVEWYQGFGTVRRFGHLIGTASPDGRDLYRLTVEYKGHQFSQRHLSFKQLLDVPEAWCEMIDKRRP